MSNKNKIVDYKLKTAGEQSLNNYRKAVKSKGFSLVEVVLGIALVGIALLGLAQLFFYSVMNNTRSDRMTNATFLAQQQIDFLRNLPAEELHGISLAPVDEQMDINSDGLIDFRRITQLQASGFFWNVRVMVFTGLHSGVDVEMILQNPSDYQVRADISTIISR